MIFQSYKVNASVSFLSVISDNFTCQNTGTLNYKNYTFSSQYLHYNELFTFINKIVLMHDHFFKLILQRT